ncbi:hypothetical protein AAMO2058_000229200 [Amorphochlora amoebiformis]
MSDSKKGQKVYIIRHGDRMDRGIDKESEEWQKLNPTNEDTPISYIGRKQAEDTGEFLMKEVDPSNAILISSPWLRCMQTSRPFAVLSKIPEFLDPAFGEGAEFCTHASPDHSIKSDFKGLVDKSYKPLLDGKAPKTDMTNVAEALIKRFGYKSGRSIIIFSHADPCIYLAAALTGKKSIEMNVASPTAMWTLEQPAEGKPYNVVQNGRIDHLSIYGQTKPWHHDHDMVKKWRALGWPPPGPKAEGGNALAEFLETYHSLFTSN